MSFLSYIRQLFRSPALANAAVQPVAGPVPALMPQPLPIERPVMYIPHPAEPPGALPPGPAWLDDEDILRDEGILFGLSDARPDEVISLIRHEFAKQTALLEPMLEQHNEKIGELNLFIDQYENQISELRYKVDELTARPPVEHQLIRTVAGQGLSVLMSTGTFFLIDETLRPAFAESRWIAVGVFLAGMFTLFNRTSLFHDTVPATPRRWLEEAGLPLAASLFVFVQALKTQSIGSSLAIWFFVFFLFLLAGKLLLGNLTVLLRDLRAISQNRQAASDRLVNGRRWEQEADRLRLEIDRFRVQKWQIIPESNRVQADLTRLNARRDGLIKLFESEFNLARSLRDRLTQQQRQAIAGQ